VTTGWKWIRDDGEEFKSERAAMSSLRERPESMFEFSELSMAGEKRTDVTDKLRAAFAALGEPRP
jgi:hypothetical protein